MDLVVERRNKMAEQRLSKLQKWILTNCFMVTIMLDRSKLKKIDGLDRCFDQNKCPSYITKERNENNIVCMKCSKKPYCKAFNFYKEDILLSFFNLEKSMDKMCWDRVQHFKQAELNNKAYVTLHRSINNLVQKELIDIITGCRGDSIFYQLTDKGIETALKLFHLDNSVVHEPPLLTDDECENERKKSDLQIKAIMRELGS